MKSVILTIVFVMLISNLQVDSKNGNIQKISRTKPIGKINLLFNMDKIGNKIILQRMNHINLEVVFAESLTDFTEKILLLSGRYGQIKFSDEELQTLYSIKIDEDNREEMLEILNYYKNLVASNADARTNYILMNHPLLNFDDVTKLLIKWLETFRMDVHGTKDRDEFYVKMQLNSIKNNIGYMVLFYYLFDAQKFYMHMYFNYPSYRLALYKRVEKEMPYIVGKTAD